MAKWAGAEFGRIDVLINNAALYYDQDIMDEILYLRKGSRDQPDRAAGLRTRGLPGRASSIRARSSTSPRRRPIRPAAATMPFDNFSTNAYGLSVSGMIYDEDDVAQGRSDGIRVNAIAPGVTMSEATKKINLDSRSRASKVGSPMGMTLEPDDLMGTAVYLASEDSRLMTGQTLVGRRRRLAERLIEGRAAPGSRLCCWPLRRYHGREPVARWMRRRLQLPQCCSAG
ncbi:MAG: SDR family oxidoreductase [Myxococcota bacterium]